jgi:peroxin-3
MERRYVVEKFAVTMNSDPSGRRRRNNHLSVGTLATAAVVAYGTYRLANWAWTTWNGRTKDEHQEFSASAHHADGDTHESRRIPAQQQQWRLRRARLERCRDEAATALKDFLPTLQRAVEQATDSMAETKALKKLRADKLSGILPKDHEERDLWDAVKVQSFTRMVSTAYAHSILFLVLTVQVNLLGGRLFHEQMRNQASNRSLGDDSVASDRMSSYQTSHRLVLTRTYEHFFQRGIASLVQTVERAVSDVLRDWDVTNPSSMHTSRDMMEKALSQIRDVIEGRTAQRRSRRPRSMIRFLLPPEPGLDAHTPNELAQAILDETWDLMESPVVEDAQRDCLNVTFDLMRDKCWGNLFCNTDAPQHASPWTTKPLASVITQLKRTSNSFYKSPATQMLPPRPAVNIYASAMERLPAVLELADISFN